MINRTFTKIAFFISFTAASLSVYPDHVPHTAKGDPYFQLRAITIFKAGDFSPSIEVQGRLNESDDVLGYRALTAGTYYRIHRNVKIGLFYRLQAGAVHDDDWKWLNPGWEWENTFNRYENVLIADISPRFLIDFLPGKNWVFSIKNRYEINLYNGHQSIFTRPGVTWFYMKDRIPKFNISFHYGVYIPLNFSDSFIYEHTPYLSLIYRIDPSLNLELSGALKNTTWTSSEDIPISGEPDYSTVNRNIVIGIGLIYTFDR